MVKIIKAYDNEIKQMIPIYAQAFSLHNIFKKDENFVFDYLKKQKGEFLAALDGDKVIGGVIVHKRELDGHILARLRHFAVAKEYRDKGVGSELLEAAEKSIGKGKIEMHVSENESRAISFYKKNGYVIEGNLTNHYRDGEICYVMGKTIR